MNEEEQSIFEEIKSRFIKGVFKEEAVFCFAIIGADRAIYNKTVYINSNTFRIEDSKAKEADCYCEIEEDMLRKIYYDHYKPTLKDIMTGRVKVSNPSLLKDFLKAFGKE